MTASEIDGFVFDQKLLCLQETISTNHTDESRIPSWRTCGCKGVRSCRLCENPGRVTLQEHQNDNVYNFCLRCQKPLCETVDVVPSDVPISTKTYGKRKEEKDSSVNERNTSLLCDHHCQMPLDFSGVVVIEDFITEKEEHALCDVIYQSDFVLSQSGRRKQDYGPKVNFKKKKLRCDSFTGLPSYSRFLYDRMKQQEGLTDFEPVELCNLEYCSQRGAHIDPHFDDSWLWGERLITLNLLSDSALTFTSDKQPGVAVKVPLLRRSLIVVQAEARHMWKHGICRADVNEKRVAMTFRELSAEFKLGGIREDDGEELLQRALTFQGCAVGVA